MAEFWPVILLVLTVAEITKSNLQIPEVPLSRSLGFHMRRHLPANLQDSRLNQQYVQLYQEMMRASQETLERFQDPDAVLDVGRVKAEVKKRGASEQRSRVHSPVGLRRARSRACRLHKLNGQSLRNHQHHARHAGRHKSLEVDTD